MSTPNNLVTRTADVVDTDAYFTNLSLPTGGVPTDTNAAIESFFEQVTKNKESARLMAGAVINTCLAQQVDPMAVIAEFRKIPQGDLNIKLSTFLNLNRANTSLLGVTNSAKTGFFVQRSILA